MTKRAQLADGTILEFPDGTPDAVMDRAVQEHIAQSRRTAGAQTWPGTPVASQEWPGTPVAPANNGVRVGRMQNGQRVSAAQRPPQRVSYQGRTHEFPADFSEQEISTALHQYEVEGDDGTIYEVQAASDEAARARVRAHLAGQGGSSERQTATNPQTGERVELVNGQWVPMRGQRQPARASQPDPTNDAERRAVGEGMARRQLNRQATPGGWGYITQPMVDLITDPVRRDEAGRSIAAGADWMRQQAQGPPIDLPRLGREGAASAQRMWNDLPRTAGQVLSHPLELGRALTYGPFEDEAQAQQRLDLERFRGDDVGAREAAQDANVATVHAGVNTIAPLAAGGNAVRTGLNMAAIDAPFALSRGHGSLQERLPDALPEIGGAFALGFGGQVVGNRLPAAARATRLAPRTTATVDAFERANVPPIYAAARGKEAAPLTMIIADNVLAGGGVRRNLERSAQATATEAGRIANEYGLPLSREGAGETVQAGARRWGNEHVDGPETLAGARSTPSHLWSFDSKANSLYGHVEGRIQATEEQALQAARTGDAPALTTIENSRATLNDILGSVRNEEFRTALLDKDIARFHRLVNNPQGRVYFSDLRALRTHVRTLQKNPQFRQGVNDAALQRLERALTEDINTSARNIGGAQAEHMLRRVDQFYQAGSQRIARALRPFVDARTTPSAAYDRILQLARDSGSGTNTQAMLALKRTLRPDEFRTVQATLINRLGRVTKGSPEAMEAGAFSIENFVTNYAELSPAARNILFGTRGGGATQELAQALDNLAYVAGRQKAVRGFTNYSRSGTSVQNLGTYGLAAHAVGGAAFGHFLPMLELVGGVLGMRVMGEALTNPAFVRWIVRAQAAAKRGVDWRRQLPSLAAAAARDPALMPVYTELNNRQGQSTPRAPASGFDPSTAQPAFDPSTAQPAY